MEYYENAYGMNVYKDIYIYTQFSLTGQKHQ